MPARHPPSPGVLPGLVVLPWRAGAGTGGGTNVPSLLALFLLMHRLGILPATAPGRGPGAVLGGNWCRRRC